MYILKQIPEDFVVTEIRSVMMERQGPYSYCLLTKKNWNTLDIVKKIAGILHIKEKQIGFAGSKDRNAVTSQLISLRGVSKEKLHSVKIDDCRLTLVGFGNNPISLGDLEGNKFEIVVRNLTNETITRKEYTPNYFDEQRFGSNNVEVGRCLITKQFLKALENINNGQCNQHLQKNKNDLIGALKKLPLRLLRLYINAYQSYLWNEALAVYLRKHGTIMKEVPYSQGTFIFAVESFPELRIPLVGFDNPAPGEQQEIIDCLLQKEKIDHKDFIIKQIPELTVEGEMRKAFVPVNDLKIGRVVEDDLNEGKKKVKLSFVLPKGSYGTIAVKFLINY